MCKKLIYFVSFLVLSLILASGAKAADPNLIGWWPLNEGAGDIAIDLSGNGNDGTINNLNGGLGTDGSVWVDDPERGMVVSFNGDNGSGAYIGTDLIIPAMTMDNGFTWAFWAKQHESQGTEVPGQGNDLILGNRYAPDGSDPLEFIKFTPGNFEYYNNDPDYTVTINYDDIPGGVWIHHAGVKDGTTLTYYRNGVEAGTSTITFTIQANPFFMGGISNGERWSGHMSNVRTYNRALTGLEVLAIVKDVEQIDMEIGYAIQPPVLDGEYDGIWSAASTQSFVPLADPANASGTWKVLYDAQNLYVMVDMSDDILMNDSDSSWQDDSVEIYFDGGNTKLNTPLSGDDHQYTFGWTTDDIQGTNITGYTEGIEHAQVTTDTGWRIEVKMPWLSIWGVVPQDGDLVGIDCYYNDDDDGGDSRENKLLSFSAIEGWNDASQWGTAVLAIAPEPVDPGTDGLVAYYALENNTDDSSGNDLHGTIIGAPTYVEGPAGYGTAMEFDGESYVDCGFDPRLDITGPISIGIWIKPGTDGTVETAPLSKADSVRGWSWQLRYGWFTDKPTIMGFQFNATGGSVWVFVNQDLAIGEWYHIAASHDGATVKCYLDGVETDSAPMTGIVGGPSSLLIGSDGWRSDWIGAVDEIAIYDRGLSDEEVLYLAGFPEAPPEPKTVVYDFETDAQGWGDLKDGTATTVVGETHAGGGSQSLRSTIDETAHDQQQGGWASSRDFTADDAAGGISTLSFWYRADDPDMNGGNFVFHWISSTENWSGGGWYGNGLWGVLIADGQWHQQTVDLSILGEDAGGWEGTWGDQTAWEFRDDLLYSFEILFEPTDNTTTGSNIFIDDVVFSGPGE